MKMLVKFFSLVIAFACCEGSIYSSFWAPLFNPRILNFRVDAPFDPEAGARARGPYETSYGRRGEKLIEALGNGKGPNEVPLTDKGMRDVKFYYTYPGANQDEPYIYKR